MIKVGFGLTVLNNSEAVGGIDGIGTYTKELKNQLLNVNDQLELLPFTVGVKNQVASLDPDLFRFGDFRASLITSALSGLPFSGSARLARSVDLVHATDHHIPNVGKLPLVATIMDAIPLSHPEWTSLKLRSLKNYLWVKSAHWADRVITISDFSKSEIIEHFKIPAERIDVVPLGVDERWFKHVSDQKLVETRLKFNLPAEYFLAVGTLQPRKNIQRLINAYLSLPEAVKSEVPLVIVGREGWGCDELVSSLASGAYGSSIIWLNHISGDDLLPLVKSAQALVFPSLFEGFGLPVLEAFAAGTAVIASNTTSVPEVTGDAALLIDPLDESSIAAGMLEVIENNELRLNLVKKGQERTLNFSWQKTAERTLDVYKKVLA